MNWYGGLIILPFCMYGISMFQEETGKVDVESVGDIVHMWPHRVSTLSYYYIYHTVKEKKHSQTKCIIPQNMHACHCSLYIWIAHQH